MQTSYKKNVSKNNSWPLLSFSPMCHFWVACLYLRSLKLNAYGLAVASWNTGFGRLVNLYLGSLGKCAVID